jgi:Right handed beta helix region
MISTKLASIGIGAALSVVLLVLPAHAQRTYVANGGSNGGGCTFSTPCSSMTTAVFETQSGGTLSCLNDGDYGAAVTITVTMTIDCIGTTANIGPFTINGPGITVTIKNVSIYNRNAPAISFNNGARLYLDNVTIDDNTIALSVQAAEPTTVVVSNSTIKDNVSGVLLKPASGGSVTATFDGVTIVNNTGGLRTDSTNGAVRVDVANSTISNNTANGIVAIGGAGGNSMMTLKNDIIASNGQAGIVVSGTTAAVLVNNSVLDSNTTGATSAVSGGRILTYGNNSIIGPTGFGFTSSTPLQ